MDNRKCEKCTRTNCDTHLNEKMGLWICVGCQQDYEELNEIAYAKARYSEHRDECNTCNGVDLCDDGLDLWEKKQNLIGK